MSGDPLHEIAPERLHRFLKTLNDCQPESGSVHATIKKTLELSQNDPEFQWILLTTNNGEDTGTCVLVTERINVLYMCLYARPDEVDRLTEALKETSKIAWHRNPRIYRLDERLLEPLTVALVPKVRIKKETERIDMLWLSSEKALSLKETSLPKGLTVRNLEERDAAEIARVWKYGGSESQTIIRYTIQHNTSFGVDNDKGELIAWILWGCCGGLSHLHVNYENRRHGVGRFLVTKLVKVLAHNGYNSMANVTCSNCGSRALFHSLGFQHAFFNYYLRTEYTGNK